MQILEILRDGSPLGRVDLGATAIEVGADSACDVSLQDADLAPRHYLVMPLAGSVVALDISAGAGSRAPAIPLPPDRPIAVGRHHALVRRSAAQAGLSAAGESRLRRGTEPMALEPVSRLRLLQGRGSEARRHAIGEAPLSIGRDRGNDVVLCDRAASARHCRIEPTGGRLHVRDLGSRNGTQINGVRVDRAELVAGDVLRVGRSDLLLVEQAPAVADRRSLVAESPASLSLLAEARRYAELPWPALVLGESGSGKEGIAELLHSAGPRAGGPLVALNAGGVPTELVESELFGHEKGAFTGAAAMRRGVFEQADGGTLFLDEIGELPLSLQARLLRVLETGEVRRVGAESAREVDVRLVCATHRDLRAMVGRGEFRQDLFFRIARIVLEVAPLRERRADIDALADHFLRELSGVLGPRSLGEGARNRLRAYRWPGNVRELRNVLSAAAASSTARVLEQEDVDRALLQVGAGDPQAQTLDHMRRVLEQHGGNLTAAARALGIPRTTLRDRVRHYRARP